MGTGRAILTGMLTRTVASALALAFVCLVSRAGSHLADLGPSRPLAAFLPIPRLRLGIGQGLGAGKPAPRGRILDVFPDTPAVTRLASDRDDLDLASRNFPHGTLAPFRGGVSRRRVGDWRSIG